MTKRLGTPGRLASANPATAQHQITIINHSRLPWRHGTLWFVQANASAIVLQRRDTRGRAGMVVTNFYRRFEPKARITDPRYRVPVHVIDFEFIANRPRLR